MKFADFMAGISVFGIYAGSVIWLLYWYFTLPNPEPWRIWVAALFLLQLLDRRT